MDQIENIFRNSNNNDELFDAFQSAIKKPVEDLETYKILLCNPVLTEDEVIMYTAKLAKEFEEKQFEIYFWTAGLFENSSLRKDYSDYSFEFYKKAAEIEPHNFNIYCNLLNLYNYDLDLPLNKQIINLAESAIPHLEKKKKLFKKLSDHYKKVGNDLLYKKYSLLANKAREDQ